MPLNKETNHKYIEHYCVCVCGGVKYTKQSPLAAVTFFPPLYLKYIVFC